MKKLLLTVIVSLALCGSALAQYTSNWSDFDYHAFDDHGALVAAITIDGVIVDTDYANWDAFEVAAFCGDECRGAGVPELEAWYLSDEYVLEFGDPFPILNGASIYYNGSGNDLISFKMYDHVNGVLYEACTVTYLGEPYEVYANVDNDQGWWDPDNPIFLNFTTPAGGGETFTKEIVGYGEGDNYWYFIASPVEEDVVPTAENGFFAATEYDLFYFDQTSFESEWRAYDAESFNVVNGKGYLYASKENTTLTFTGTPFLGDDGYAEVELVYDGDEGHAWYGWNLVGNPFADSAYADRPFYRLDPESSLYIECTEDDVIPMMEGVFVETLEQEDETMAFYAATDGSTTGSQTGGGISKLVIKVNAGRGVSDRAILRFDEGKQLGKRSFRQDGTQVYIPVDGKDYAIVNAGEMGEMPVSFKAAENGTYSLSFSNTNVSFNYLHLVDNMTGADVDLLETPSYTFEATTSDYASRFKLVFATGSSTEDSFAFYSNGNFIISNEGEATLQVVDVTGRIMMSETVNGSASVNVNAAPGVYMLRLINGDNVKVQKVVVR